MTQMWKYEVPIDGEWHELSMPCVADVRHVDQQQSRSVCFWAEVNPTAQRVPRFFCVFGTGHDVPVNAQYCGTVQSRSAPLVWHVFERKSDAMVTAGDALPASAQ